MSFDYKSCDACYPVSTHTHLACSLTGRMTSASFFVNVVNMHIFGYKLFHACFIIYKFLVLKSVDK